MRRAGTKIPDPNAQTSLRERGSDKVMDRWSVYFVLTKDQHWPNRRCDLEPEIPGSSEAPDAERGRGPGYHKRRPCGHGRRIATPANVVEHKTPDAEDTHDTGDCGDDGQADEHRPTEHTYVVGRASGPHASFLPCCQAARGAAPVTRVWCPQFRRRERGRLAFRHAARHPPRARGRARTGSRCCGLPRLPALRLVGPPRGAGVGGTVRDILAESAPGRDRRTSRRGGGGWRAPAPRPRDELRRA